MKMLFLSPVICCLFLVGTGTSAVQLVSHYKILVEFDKQTGWELMQAIVIAFLSTSGGESGC